MKCLLFGTAGHIDHGKTALIKALTGMDTDRLEEEKRRGITIDLGFAHMDIPEGTAGIIDVPGHEKFIKNMLAGAGALDLVLMVVAADEGVMPQTKEHLAILELLGTLRGLVVLTKCDMVDEEMMELAAGDVREAFAGTFLESAPVFPVSCKTRAGIPALREAICDLSRTIPEHSCKRPFRMAVDRVFTLDGFGTVATGTVLDGTVCEGEEVELCPGGKTVRIRTLQSYGRQAQTVFAGQRAALNLARVKQDELSRGDFLAAPGTQKAVMLLCVKLTLLKESARTVKSGTRLHLHLGAACVLCRVSLAETESLSAGETAYAQLRLETPVCAFTGDRFVVRFYSPLETIGGGIVLDARPKRQKRLDRAAVERLKWYDTGSLSDQIVYEASQAALTEILLLELFPHVEPDRLRQTVTSLLSDGKLLKSGELLFTPESLRASAEKVLSVLADYHAAHPLAWGMPLPELAKQVPNGLIDVLKTKGVIRCGKGWAAAPEFSPLETGTFQTAGEKIRNLYAKWGCMPQDVSSIPTLAGVPEQDAMQIIALLLEQGELEQLTPALLVSHAAYDQAKETAVRLIQSAGSVTLAQLRDEMGLSRKYAAALLEHMDDCGFTVKNGDFRTLL
ncbi:MAG: selenocysteine-specific translation elongation factor [Ruminococcaceae bacterium]|jgi:selenocysteine-specific elongation factor|nr:selenocysteine-specific translation elongation factor [Oscillospiraceae bacterium]